MSKPELQTIDPAALAQVSGGTTSTSSSNDQVLTALTGILESVQSLAASRSHGDGGLNPTEMLMMMMVLQQRNQPQPAAAATSAWPWSQDPIIRYY